MASVEKRDGAYSVRWRTRVGQEQRRKCPTRASAYQLKRDIEEAQALGYDWAPQAIGEAADLEAVTEAFIEHRTLRLRPRTLHRYAENLDLFVRFLRTKRSRGPLPPSMLSKPMLEEYYAWLCRPENGLHKRARSSDTARKIAEVAQLCWSWAEASERWPDQIPRPKKIEMVRAEASAVVSPTWAQMDACVEHCAGWQKKLLIFLRYTGLRVGETMLLTWSDVDLVDGTLHLRREIVKSGPGRTIPLSKHLRTELATWEAREGWLIPSGRKQGVRERQARARDISRAWARAEVPEAIWKRRPDHAFRKGFKSGLLQLRAQEDAVDYLQGHSLGGGSSRGRYIDPNMLGLRATVDLVPRIGEAALLAAPTENSTSSAVLS